MEIKRMKNTTTIAYQGTKGSWSHQACHEFFGDEIETQGMRSFRHIFHAVETGDVECAMVPIENTIAGSVAENFDYLYSHDLDVVGEIAMKITWTLFGIAGTKKENVQNVYSHYKALEQCQNFFLDNPSFEQKEYFDTAGAAEYVAQEQNPSFAALASKEAGKRFGLTALQRDVGDVSDCWTRFLVVKKKSSVESREHTINSEEVIITFLVAFSLKDAKESGSLHAVLKMLADHDISLTRIESRPIPEKPFEYVFYTEFHTSHHQSKNVQKAFDSIQKQTKDAKMFGPYAKHEIS